MEGFPLQTLLLALCWAGGMLLGRFASMRCIAQTGEELMRYLKGYLSGAGKQSLSAEVVVQTLCCYYRAPAAAFLFGFASIGAIALPVLCAAQGFVLSFSLFCFAVPLGREGFLTLAVLFALRLAVVVPCTIAAASAAMEKSCSLLSLSFGSGKRSRPVSYGAPYWYRFLIVCVCLLLGSVTELWLVPRLLAALG